MSQPLPDHYRTLGVAQSAGQDAVRKAFRKLAFQHHPDQQPDNPFAEARFIQIHDAYRVLSDVAARRRYDEERWLLGFSSRRAPQELTPEWLASRAAALRSHIATIDTYRMNHDKLASFLDQLLSEAHLAVMREGNGALRAQVAGDVLLSVRSAQPALFERVTQRLSALAEEPDNEVATLIAQAQHQYRKRQEEQRWKPYLVLLIVLALCGMLFLLS